MLYNCKPKQESVNPHNLCQVLFTLMFTLSMIHLALAQQGHISDGLFRGNYRQKIIGATNAMNQSKSVKHSPRSYAPIKRDVSLSYSATDIDSKEGSRVKTITVIKNLNSEQEKKQINGVNSSQSTSASNAESSPQKNNSGGNEQKLFLNPELFKNEDWASAFRDNFDSYGSIPDVPDIDDLFTFMNKDKTKKVKLQKFGDDVVETVASGSKSRVPNSNINMSSSNNTNDANAKTSKAAKPSKPTVESKVDTLTSAKSSVMRSTNSMRTNSTGGESAEKIKGDAEYVPFLGGKRYNSNEQNNTHAAQLDYNNHYNQREMRSQSLSLSTDQRRYESFDEEPNYVPQRMRESLINVNYSTPQHSVHQYFENYVQLPPKQDVASYNYPRPCLNYPSNSVVTVSTPSGRMYDVPSVNNAGARGIMNPYIAPSVARRPPYQQQQPQAPPQQSTVPGTSVPQIPVGQNPQQPIAPSQTAPVTFPPNSVPPTQQPQAPIPGYTVNSILPPLQSNNNYPTTPVTPPLSQPQPIPVVGGVGSPTTQRPYVAPNLRNGLGFSRGPPPISPIYRGSNVFGPNANRLNTARSRGLKY